jgi:hypothetical protein
MQEVRMSKQTKKQKPSAPIIAKGQEKAVFAKLVSAATSYDQAWQFIHKTFARAKFGRVRDVVQKFSDCKTLRAAFNSMHGKKGAKRAA